MKTLYDSIVDCFRTRKVQPVQPELTELDLFLNSVRLHRETSLVLNNSFKERSAKLKSGKIE